MSCEKCGGACDVRARLWRGWGNREMLYERYFVVSVLTIANSYFPHVFFCCRRLLYLITSRAMFSQIPYSASGQFLFCMSKTYQT